MWFFKKWRQARIIQKLRPAPDIWEQVVSSLPILQGLTQMELERLLQRSVLFLHAKHFSYLEIPEYPTQAEQLRLSATAQLPLLMLPDLDWYQNFHEVLVYPIPFHTHQTHQETSGVHYEQDELHSGETWLQGPVILSWATLKQEGGWLGHNLVIHELAHKLDLLNGSANGHPPLHANMALLDWTQAFQEAFDSLKQVLDKHPHSKPCIDAYAATNPAEFFAVTSEYFFTAPLTLKQIFPAVYHQLSLFYRQDPFLRWQSAQLCAKKHAKHGQS